MPLSFVVVCEARADKDTAAGFADAVFRAELGLSQAQVETKRRWQGLGAADDYLKWSNLKNLVQQRLSHVQAHVFHGHFRGEPGGPDAFVARRALLVLLYIGAPADAVFLIKDDDRESERRRGLEQARDEARDKHGVRAPIAIGLAHPEREAWVLTCFVPRSDRERRTLDELTSSLSFSPVQQPERLNGEPGEPRDIKRVLAALTNGDEGRERRCWEEADVEELKRRGTGTGLAAYLQEVEQRVVPLLGTRKGAAL